MRNYTTVLKIAPAFLLLAGTIYIIELDPLKDFDPDKITSIDQTLFIYDKNGELVSGIYGTQNRESVDIEQVPDAEGNMVWQYHEIQYDKDEYIQSMADQVTSTQLALAEIYEGMI